MEKEKEMSGAKVEVTYYGKPKKFSPENEKAIQYCLDSLFKEEVKINWVS